MTEEEIIDKLISTMENAIDEFNTSIPGIQKSIANEVEDLIRNLETKNGNIKVSVANIRKIAAFRAKILAIIRNSDYSDKVNEFLDAFETVSSLQNQYFEKVSSDFKPSKLLEEIKAQSISSTIESLTEGGLNENLVKPIGAILQKNATTGGSIADMQKQLRDFVIGENGDDGELVKYTKQIVNGAINDFSGQYMNHITNDLGLEWFWYTGSLIKTSRIFCEACVKKKYIHRSEFQSLLDGDFKEFKDLDGQIYDKTGLPQGLTEGTTPENFQVYAGGHSNNCQHQVVPVSSAVVPQYLRDKFA